MKKIIGITAVLGLAFAAQADVTIGAVGGTTDYATNGNEVASYYTTSVTKNFDVGVNDNRYGSDGYYVFGGTTSQNTMEYNDARAFKSVTPTFVDSITADTGNTLSRANTSQTSIDDPTAIVEGTDFNYSGYIMNNGTPGTMMQFSVTDSDALSFRFGVMAGSEGTATSDGRFDPSALGLSFDDFNAGTTDPTVTITSLPIILVDDIGMVFFDVTLDAGTTGTFTLSAAERTNNATIAGITFDVIPEPATLGLVAMFGGGILFIRRRFML